MAFLYSLKLFGSNWRKALKLFLYTLVIWGVCFALLLPCFFEFKGIFTENFATFSHACYGVFGKGALGESVQNLLVGGFDMIKDIFAANLGLAIYGTLVLFVLLPFLFNIGKYAFCTTLHAYMTSKNKMGFCSALVKTLNKSTVFAIFKTTLNLFCFAIIFGALFGLKQITDKLFVTVFLPILILCLLILIFSLFHLLTLGLIPALIVFNCNVFSAFRKSLKAVERHFWSTFATTLLHFAIFFVLVLVFGVYTMIVLVPLLSVALCVFNMTSFFISQGMRFYYDENNILTPKKLEEVDKIKKTVYIL